jgi:hypothetical protein
VREELNMEEEGWKAKEVENMFGENKEDEGLKYLNKHSHFHPYGFTLFKKPFKYMRINTVLRCMKKYTGLDLELSFVRKRKRTEVSEDEAENEEGTEEVENDGTDRDEEGTDENEVEKSDNENEEDEVEKSDESDVSSSEDEICKSVKRMKFKRSGESSDSEEDSSDSDTMRKKFRTKTNVCTKCKKNFSTKSNLTKHYARCLEKTD